MLDKQCDIVLDDVFLVEKGFLGKGMGEGSTLTGVVGVVCHGEGCYSGEWLD